MLVLVFMLSKVSEQQRAYDRDRDCPAKGTAHSCSCTATEIECFNRGISRIPTFTKTSYVFTTIDLANNNITRIGRYDFNEINVTEVNLANNMITTIENEAFSPIQSQIKFLDLRNNRLTYLEPFFEKLTSLQTIDVSYNPIPPENFTNNVMREIGDYVKEFRFGDPSLNGWPSTLHHLPRLEILKFYGGNANMERIPIKAFSGFEWTLRKLWIQNTNLISTPIALQDLKSTTEFHFDNNPNVGDAGILVPAFAGLTRTLTTLTLENNGLTTFPSVLMTLGQIHNLSLARNNLQFVSDQAISVVASNLTTLNLQACNLDRIPGALSRLRHLQNIDFSYNNITTIEKNDLQLMGNLINLDVSFNPLQYISNSTFYDLASLKELILKETYLTLVPEAISKLGNLAKVDLSAKFSDIECNCDLSWLYCYKQRNTNLTIDGDCYTIEMKIQKYATEQIPQTCPITC